MVNFVVGIISLVGNTPFSLIVLWYLIGNLEEILLVLQAVVSQLFRLDLENPYSLSLVNFSLHQISRVILGGK